MKVNLSREEVEEIMETYMETILPCKQGFTWEIVIRGYGDADCTLIKVKKAEEDSEGDQCLP
jgi:hypothetical protein